MQNSHTRKLDTKIEYQVLGTKHQLQSLNKEWHTPDHHNLIVLCCVLIDAIVCVIHLIFWLERVTLVKITQPPMHSWKSVVGRDEICFVLRDVKD